MKKSNLLAFLLGFACMQLVMDIAKTSEPEPVRNTGNCRNMLSIRDDHKFASEMTIEESNELCVDVLKIKTR